jgi:hypothetical protein
MTAATVLALVVAAVPTAAPAAAADNTLTACSTAGIVNEAGSNTAILYAEDCLPSDDFSQVEAKVPLQFTFFNAHVYSRSPDWNLSATGDPKRVFSVQVADQGYVAFASIRGACEYVQYIFSADYLGAKPAGWTNCPEAAADIPTWVQQIERPTAETPCPPGWGGSWAQWANGGRGGYVCSRDVVAIG